MRVDAAKPKSLGELIQLYRKNKKMSLSKLQEIIGLHKGSLSRIESGGVKRPDFQSILSIAAALEIPHSDIVEQYIEIGHKSNVIYSILQNELATLAHPSLITKIASKFLESPCEESFELVGKLFGTIDSIEDASIQLSLYRLIIDYSRAHGIMPYIAKGLYRKYMIERNDFSKLRENYQSGKYILDYANFLSSKEKIIAHYSLAVHAYNLMLYEDCIKLCSYILDNEESLSEYKANAFFSISCAYHYLGEYEKSQIFLDEYRKFPFPYVSDNVKLMTGITNGKLGKTELAILKLQEYLKNPSASNLIYAVTELFNLYLCKNDFESAEGLLKYEDSMLESIHDIFTTPFKRSRLAHFYLLKGTMMLNARRCEEAFDCYIESTSIYMNIGVYDKALVSLLHINQAQNAMDNPESLPRPEIAQKMNSLHDKLYKKASNNPQLVSKMMTSLSWAKLEIPEWLKTMLISMSTSEFTLPDLPGLRAK